MLEVATIIAILIGFVHSILGEKYILVRLFRRDNLPKLFGDDRFTKQTLRFAWHITTIAWWGFAAILWSFSQGTENLKSAVLLIIGITFLISGVISFAASKGKHLSYLTFWAIAALSWFSITA